ncbi:MAG TPA: hypothetical protein VFH97_05990, partial [Gemmatimonadales bacterium]|nr:hypothetical protein [Gemmatimonadales bacterium]
IDAVTGKSLRPGLERRPQNYLAIPEQPWLDGYCVEKGIIRQFVAMPLGAGYTVEEQITGEAEHGGLQLVVYPMKREVYERLQRSRSLELDRVVFSKAFTLGAAPAAYDMGLAPGGRMRQEIFDDPHALADWDQDRTSRCFVHLANSLVWRQITGRQPPTVPPTAREYSQAGLPWFEYYDDGLSAVEGSDILRHLKSVMGLGKQKGDVPLPENQSVEGMSLIELRKGLKHGQVREGRF